jgi:hypothetical protein
LKIKNLKIIFKVYCKLLTGELQNAIMYSGFVKDDMAHGVGDIFSNNKTCYKGKFKKFVNDDSSNYKIR